MRILIENTTAYVGDAFKRLDGVSLLIESGKIAAVSPDLTVDNAERMDGSSFFYHPWTG